MKSDSATEMDYDEYILPLLLRKQTNKNWDLFYHQRETKSRQKKYFQQILEKLKHHVWHNEGCNVEYDNQHLAYNQ